MSKSIDDLVRQIDSLERRVADLETQEPTSKGLVDYGATSTVVGWSSFTSKQISYTIILSKFVLVIFYIRGTSNSTSVTFTLPFTAKSGFSPYQFFVRGRDNSVNLTAPSYGSLPASSNVVTIAKDMADALWTATGDKWVLGQFIYERA